MKETQDQQDQRLRLEFLREHLPYEVQMLEFSAACVNTMPPSLSWNAYYECFCIHARVLYEFLNNDGSDAFKAHEFVQNFSGKKSNETIRIMPMINRQVLHAGKKRTIELGKKANLGDVEKLYCWLRAELERFSALLSADFPFTLPPRVDHVVYLTDGQSSASSMPSSL